MRVAFVAAALVISGPAAAQSWQEYTYPAYAFSVAFPADPQIETTTYQVADGRAVEAHVYTVRRTDAVFKVTVAELANTGLAENAVIDHAFVPSISRQEIAEAFDNRVQQLEGRDSAEAIAETLRPLAGLSLASVVIRTATQVAAADRHLHPGEVRALRLIRLALTTQEPGSNSSGGSTEEAGSPSD